MQTDSNPPGYPGILDPMANSRPQCNQLMKPWTTVLFISICLCLLRASLLRISHSVARAGACRTHLCEYDGSSQVCMKGTLLFLFVLSTQVLGRIVVKGSASIVSRIRSATYALLKDRSLEGLSPQALRRSFWTARLRKCDSSIRAFEKPAFHLVPRTLIFRVTDHPIPVLVVPAVLANPSRNGLNPREPHWDHYIPRNHFTAWVLPNIGILACRRQRRLFIGEKISLLARYEP
ncbi:hypothetical protein FA15DRAFT_139572 [Coprinopsis marcescibilis]|uniref:Uncharacterized protein n=1 Tax=Coprinopsis marcescibilis TaxID=230819 RepID=A0A5C3KJZ0_COPMA|nr:hypothetical protein FA15DRAFT_139572 [Coprinopsis marcescibilis]